MFHKLDDVIQYCSENNVQMVDFKLTDIDGRWRHLTIPIERLNT